MPKLPDESLKIFRVRFDGPFLAESEQDAISQMRAMLGANVIAAVDVAQCTNENFRKYDGPWKPLATYLDGTKA